MSHLIAMPNNRAEFRYSTHEATEECHHTQMFQEAVNRIGADVPGMPKPLRALARSRASWYALSWFALDAHRDYDEGASALFKRGAYRLGPPATVSFPSTTEDSTGGTCCASEPPQQRGAGVPTSQAAGGVDGGGFVHGVECGSLLPHI